VIDGFLFKKGLQLEQLTKTKELKAVIRHGVPLDYRAKIWWQVSGAATLFKEGYYENLLKEFEDKKSSATQQIELVRPCILFTSSFVEKSRTFSFLLLSLPQDVLRTLPNNIHFCSQDAPGIAKLRRILVAYSWRNAEVGYCQGMNLLASTLILVFEEDEERAFWVYAALVELIMPEDYFTSNLLLSQADQRVLREIVNEKFPRLLRHLDANGVELGLITFNWFLTAYVDCLPPETLMRIWDCFLFEGAKTLFRFALGIIKMNEGNICKLGGSTAIFNYMKNMTQRLHDVEELMKVSFIALSPFPSKAIQASREKHAAMLQDELKELESQRAENEAILLRVRAATAKKMESSSSS